MITLLGLLVSQYLKSRRGQKLLASSRTKRGSVQPSAWNKRPTTSCSRVTTLRLSWNTILFGAITPQWARVGPASLRLRGRSRSYSRFGAAPSTGKTIHKEVVEMLPEEAQNSSGKEPRWANTIVWQATAFFVWFPMSSKQLRENERMSPPQKKKNGTISKRKKGSFSNHHSWWVFAVSFWESSFQLTPWEKSIARQLPKTNIPWKSMKSIERCRFFTKSAIFLGFRNHHHPQLGTTRWAPTLVTSGVMSPL